MVTGSDDSADDEGRDGIASVDFGAGAVPSGPLAGVRVVDVTINVLGPMATQILGDMGAEVVKVEPPAGDPMRGLGPARNPGMASHFLSLNRNKRSLVLNLKQPYALEALRRLVATADVFVHNMRSGAAARLSVDYAALAPANPRLVYASATGYRQEGRYRDRPAFDDVIQGESGLAALIGRANGEPRYVPMAIADKYCGVVLASAIAMALFERERSGRGQEIHVPMLETMIAFNIADHLWHATFDEAEKGIGYPRMLTPHRRPYATSDGHICLLAVTDAQWRRLFQAIGREAMAKDPRFATMDGRTAHIDLLYATLGEVLSTRSTAEWRARLDEADVPNGPMNDFGALLSDPYLTETEFFRRFEHPSEGPMLTTAVGPAFSRTPGNLHRPAPRLGSDTLGILQELGYDSREIAVIAGDDQGEDRTS